MDHEEFIRKAYDLAISAGKKGNHTFGALLVQDGAVIATGENSVATGQGYGHAEYNLVIQCAAQFSERVLQECTLYTSTAPCPRCSFAILALGIQRIVFGVSYTEFDRLTPGMHAALTIHEIIRRLDLKDVEVLGPFLEAEGMRVFEYWGGEYHPLEELLKGAGRV